MAPKNTTIILYSNGKIIQGSEGISYSNIRSSGRISIGRNTKYNELISKIHCSLGTRKNGVQLKLTFRLPTVIGYGLIRYTSLLIENDDDVDFMLDVPSQCPALNFLELYVEKESITSPTYPDINPDFAAYGRLLQDNISIPTLPGAQPFNEWLRYNESYHPQSQNEHGNAGPSYIHEEHNQHDNVGTSYVQEEPIQIDNFVTSYVHEEPIQIDNAGTSYVLGDHQNESIQSPNDPTMDSHDNVDDDEDEAEESDSDENNNKDNQNNFVSQLENRHNEAGEMTPFYSNKGNNDDFFMYEGDDISQRPLWNADDAFLQKGMIFADKLELQEAVKIYSIKQHREYVVKESNKSGWAVCCAKFKSNEACHWSLRAKKKATHGYFEITKYNDEHTCSVRACRHDHYNLDANMIASLIKHFIEVDPEFAVISIQTHVKNELGVEITYKKAWYGRLRAIEMVYGLAAPADAPATAAPADAPATAPPAFV